MRLERRLLLAMRPVMHFHALAHFGVFVCLTADIRLALGAHLGNIVLLLSIRVFQGVCLVDIERKIFLKLLNLGFRDLASLEVLLSLRL